jgi:DNA-binding Lrp family transcriptional regulator
MPTAFILLNTEIGAENRVFKALKDLEGVEFVHKLWGVYDIIAGINVEDKDKLKQIINSGTEKIGSITSKLTIMIPKNQITSSIEQSQFEIPTLP